MLSRRNWMTSVAALPAAAQAQTAVKPKNIVISSSNGVECCNIAMSWLRAGKDTLFGFLQHDLSDVIQLFVEGGIVRGSTFDSNDITGGISIGF